MVYPGSSVWAQGTLVLRTGQGMPVVTLVEPVLVPAQTPVMLEFEFGFATDETPTPGETLDSFTVTVQDAAMIHTLILLTADASGIVWLPPTPGGLWIPPSLIFWRHVPFPSLQPVLAYQSAFAVSVPLPEVYSSGPVNVYFDLFDNLNPTPSLGWFRGVQVPEPSAWALLIAGGILAWRRQRLWP